MIRKLTIVKLAQQRSSLFFSLEVSKRKLSTTGDNREPKENASEMLRKSSDDIKGSTNKLLDSDIKPDKVNEKPTSSFSAFAEYLKRHSLANNSVASSSIMKEELSSSKRSSDESKIATPEVKSNNDATQHEHEAHYASASSKVSGKFGSIYNGIVGLPQSYDHFETIIMHRLNENNRRRFRLYFFGAIVSVIVVTGLFGDSIRKTLTDKTAGLAKETLENESLKIQTQELAMAVVQTILNDKDITAHAAAFLKETSTNAETQQALLSLVLHILQHPETLDEVKRLSVKLLDSLAEDKEVQQKIVQFCMAILEDPQLKAALIKLVTSLLAEKEVINSATDLTLAVIAKPEVLKSTEDLLQKASMEVLVDDEVLQQSRQFVGDVMGDDLLQKEGGYALWNSVHYALQPGLIRLTAVGIIGISIAAFKLFVSPY